MDPFHSLSISGGRQEHVDLSQERGKIPCERNTAIFVIALGLRILSHQNFIAEGGKLQSCLEAKVDLVTLLWCTSCSISIASNLCHKCYLLTLFRHWLHLVPFFNLFFIFSLFFVPNPSSVYNASVNFHQANGLYFSLWSENFPNQGGFKSHTSGKPISPVDASQRYFPSDFLEK